MGGRRIAHLALALLAGCLVTAASRAAPARDGAAIVTETTEAPALRDRSDESLAERRRDTRREPIARLVIAGRTVLLWGPGAKTVGKVPLILFSHGLQGCASQATFLAAALADHDYVVAAPNHQDAACAGNGPGQSRAQPEDRLGDIKARNAATYRERPDDLRAVIDGLKADAGWSALIDWSRIGLMGYSLGGYTALGAAGARPAWRLPGVRAVLALAPYCAPFADRGDLAHLGVPVMYQGGTQDGMTFSVKKPGGCYDKTGAPAYFVEFADAEHPAWTDLMADHQESIVFYAVAFFDKAVKGTGGEGLGAKRDDVTELWSK